MRSLVALGVVLLLAATAPAAIVVVDSFEVDEGHFNVQPTYSGSTLGLLTTSTADRITTDGADGTCSQQLVLLEDPAVPAGWQCRHLSGLGSAGNNAPIPAQGWIGYFLKTTTPGLQTSIALDDPGTADRGNFKDVIADGAWHLYQWDMDDDDQWHGWVTGDGIITGPILTIDSVFFFSETDQDAEVYFDFVAHNPDGQIPEPATLCMLALGGLALIRRR